MVDFNGKKEEMSMEDILSSIRKYVSEEDINNREKKETSLDIKSEFIEPSLDENLIVLDEGLISSDAQNLEYQSNFDSNVNEAEYPITYDEPINLTTEEIEDFSSSKNDSNKAGPFNKLTEALKSYGKPKIEKRDNKSQGSLASLTIEQFLSSIASDIIKKWVNENLRNVVDEIITREIEKIKSE